MNLDHPHFQPVLLQGSVVCLKRLGLSCPSQTDRRPVFLSGTEMIWITVAHRIDTTDARELLSCLTPVISQIRFQHSPPPPPPPFFCFFHLHFFPPARC